jgi:outer membrane putative beta-barrel porin/alpha-amylase
VNRFLIVLSWCLVALASASAAHACSMCRCGDPTFNALGRAGLTSHGFRAALDWERFDKDEGDPADEAETQVENRYTALVAYGFSESFTLVGRFPYSSRELTAFAPGEAPEEIKTDGASDPEVIALLRVWGTPFSEVGRRTSLNLTAGIKTPWGQNDLVQNGERVDEHAQPGTGSTDVQAGMTLLRLIDERSTLFASTGYRFTGENDHGYRYGDALLASVAYERKLGRTVDVVAELDFRDAGKDQIDNTGVLDGDTGGELLYFTPRLLLDVGRGLAVRVAAQIPLVEDLNGVQDERAVFNVGMSYLWGKS